MRTQCSALLHQRTQLVVVHWVIRPLTPTNTVLMLSYATTSLLKNLSINQLFCVHSYYNNSKQYWWIYVFLIVLNDLKWNNKFYHMQHILWFALFTSNSSRHYHIHYKMAEWKLTIVRGDTPDWSETISGHPTFLFINKSWFRKVNKWVILVGGFNK